MLKATKLTLAALLVAGSYGLAAAQGTGGNSGAAEQSGVASGKPANTDTINTSKQQKTGAPSTTSGAAMQQKNTGMPANAGPNETGTAKDTAGSGTQRDPANHNLF
jgi:hypothetical protein